MSTDNQLDDLRSKIIDDPDVPEMVRKFLNQGADLEEIRLDEHGNWWHEGEIFENKRLSLLFHRSLQRTAKNNWVLHVKPYTYPVLVDLCGTFVVRVLETDGADATVRLADQSVTTLDLNSIHTDGDTVLAARVDGAPARIVDTAYRQLTRDLRETSDGYSIAVDGSVFPLSDLPDDFFENHG